MPSNDSSVWKWIATSSVSALIGVVVALVISGSTVQALTAQQRSHESLEAHPVAAALLKAQKEDYEELKDMIRALGEKMDRFHGQ